MSPPEPYWSDGQITLLLGDAIGVLRQMPDASVDCCVTSPPYYRQRDYGIEGQYGLEASPAAFVERMREVFAEVWRVLADDGTLWLNLGDTYSGSWGNQGRKPERGTQRPVNGPMLQPVHDGRYPDAGTRTGVIRPGEPPAKNLMLIPARVALALQDDGWVLRSDIIWAKRNLMPEPVTDRPTRSHEHLFLLAKRPRYYYDADAIREDSVSAEQEAHNQRYAREYQIHSERAATTGQPGNVNNVGIHSRPGKGGHNARDVWTISQTPNPQAHFATFPAELPLRCIKAGSRPGGVVLDPFSGTATTGEACRRLGRQYVGIDLNPAYHDRAASRFAQGTFEADLFSGGAA